MKVLCIEHLHEYDLNPLSRPECPMCGSRYVRRAGERAETLATVEVMEGRHAVPTESWLNDRREFVRMARETQPDMTEDEIKHASRQWFGDEEKRDV